MLHGRETEFNLVDGILEKSFIVWAAAVFLGGKMMEFTEKLPDCIN
jgi:hypothetical protein